MTHYIRDRQGFDKDKHKKDVEDHLNEMNDWLERKKKVDAKVPGWEMCPVPQASDIVAKSICLNDKGVPVVDYEYVSRFPVPPKQPSLLRVAKNELLNEISAAETEAVEKIAPPGKNRSNHFRFTDIQSQDTKVRNELWKAYERDRKEMVLSVDEVTQVTTDIDEKTVAARSPDDTAFMVAHDQRKQVLERIKRHAADLESEVEDLTSDNLHTWVIRPFT